ncbi:MAG: hypothetical protein ACIRZX_08585 [Lactobacillus crispatus]
MNNLVTPEQAKLEYELFNIRCKNKEEIDFLKQNFEEIIIMFALSKLNNGVFPFSKEQYRSFMSKTISKSTSNEFIMDCLIYSLFGTMEYQYELNMLYATSLLPIVKAKDNPLFWASKDWIKELASKSNIDFSTLHLENSTESFTFSWISKRIEYFSDEAWDTYNAAKHVLADTFELRKPLITQYPNTPFNYWNSNWGTICALMSHEKQSPSSYETFFKPSYFDLEEKMKKDLLKNKRI